MSLGWNINPVQKPTWGEVASKLLEKYFINAAIYVSKVQLM